MLLQPVLGSRLLILLSAYLLILIYVYYVPTLISSNHFELSHQLKDSGANYIFAHPGNLPLVKRILKDDLHWSDSDINLRVHTATPFKSDDVDPYTSLLSVQKQSNIPVKFDKEYNEHDVAVLCYSSGTVSKRGSIGQFHIKCLYRLVSVKVL